jgi:hypothetical protein
MQNINLTLAANMPQYVPVAGKVAVIMSADQGNGLALDFNTGNAVAASLKGMGPGARIAPVGGFSGITVTAAEAGAVSIIVTNGDIDIQITQQTAVIANGDVAAIPVRTPPGTRLAVDIGGGSVEVTATDVSINNDTAHPVPVAIVSEPGAPFAVLVNNPAGAPVPTLGVKAQTPATVAPVAVAPSTTGAALLAADATRRAVRFYNAGAFPVAITPDNATTFAQAAIVLNAGDFWSETDAPGAAWYAATGAAGAASVNLQTVKA